MSWSLLPLEVSDMILDVLVKDGGCKLACAAAVSRGWQAAIEPHTFAHIRLPLSRIAQLNSMTKRTRTLVRSLWFCIELERYDCTECNKVKNLGATSYRENELILEAFRSLFSALSAWEPDPNATLTLDTSLYSNSDAEHAFKYLSFAPDTPGLGTHRRAEQTLVTGSDEHNGDKHRWEASESGPLIPPVGTLERLFADVWLPFGDENKCWQQAPPAPAVTRLVMRLQNRRQSEPETVTQLLSHLPGLREFHYEPWRLRSTQMQENFDGMFSYLLLPATKGIKRVTIFENFNQHYPLHFVEDSYRIRAPDVTLSQRLARVNLSAEALSVSFIVDAKDFFSVSTSIWPNLTSLTLTSQLLAPKTSPAEIMNMLQAAASAARHMPNLKTLEVWNGLEGLAALFKYEFVPGCRQRSTITWRATWHVTLQSQVIEAWEDVVRGRDDHSGRINVVYESVESEEIMSHADAVVSLELSEMVIRPVSLRQILREQNFIRSTAA